MLCCDKTGTLTQNEMRLSEAMPAFLDGVSGDDLLTAAALATKWHAREQQPPCPARPTPSACADRGILAQRRSVNQPTPPPVHPTVTHSITHPFTPRWEPPADALDALVLRGVDTASLAEYEQVEFFPFDPVSRRTESTLRRRDGTMFKISKGAPTALLQMAHNYRTIRASQPHPHPVSLSPFLLSFTSLSCVKAHNACLGCAGGSSVRLKVSQFSL